jgi:hypothetical protein
VKKSPNDKSNETKKFVLLKVFFYLAFYHFSPKSRVMQKIKKIGKGQVFE